MSWKRPWKEIRKIEERLYPEFLDNIDIKGEAKEHDKIYWLIDKLSNKYTDKFKEQFNITNEYEGDESSCLADFIEEEEFINYLSKRYNNFDCYEISYYGFKFNKED